MLKCYHEILPVSSLQSFVLLSLSAAPAEMFAVDNAHSPVFLNALLCCSIYQIVFRMISNQLYDNISP